MFFNLFRDTQEQMQDLLLETRWYVGLQKKALMVETRDKLSTILSHLAIAVVCLVLGGIVLLFFSFFIAYLLGQYFGNNALGFACVTAFVLLESPDGLSSLKRGQKIKAVLSGVLPSYMVPRKFVALDAFPLNTNGKVDKKSLAALL